MDGNYLRRRLPYRAEYAASDRSTCKGCGDIIQKKSLRITFIDESKAFDGFIFVGWHHIHCFFRCFHSMRSEEIPTIRDIEHYAHLYYKDQVCIKGWIEELTQVISPVQFKEEDIQLIASKMKREDQSEEHLLEEQSVYLYDFFDKLEQMKRKEIKDLLEYNEIRIANKVYSRLYSLADAMTFGVPEKCPNCLHPDGQLVFRICGYICSKGALTTILDCDYYTTGQPNRIEFVIPEELKNKYEFLRDYRFVERNRQYISDLQIVNGSTNGESSRLEEINNFQNDPESDRMDEDIFGSKARDLNEPMDTDEYSNIARKEMKVFLKGGYSVDPDSGLSACTHIYSNFNEVLTYVKLNCNRNSFYKIQLLEEDGDIDTKYYIFLKWGRIGAQQSFKTLNMNSKDSAIQKFSELYTKRTDCVWPEWRPINRKYYRLNIQNFREKFILQSIDTKDTKHSQPVKDLICLIFNIERLKQLMFEFQIDSNQLPLGMITEELISKAREYLIYVKDIIEKDSQLSESDEIKKLHFTTAFYQTIPHISTGPHPPIDTMGEIENKLNLLTDLEQIEIVYEMLSFEDNNKMTTIADPIDHLIRKMDISIEVLDKNGSEFKKIATYVTNGNLHKTYKLNLANVFKIEKPNLQNESLKECKRLLVWHGSLVHNFADILLKGFLINPDNVFKRGQLFGPGIYFADVIIKSSRYCYIKNPELGGKALLLLCEVSNKLDVRTSNRQISNRKDYDCIKWLGQRGPYTKDNVQLDNNRNTFVPVGTVRQQNSLVVDRKRNPLNYNVYLVSDTNNIRFKYLVECDVIKI